MAGQQVKKVRSREGAAEAKAAAKMTSEQWKALQEGMAEKWPQPGHMLVEMPGRPHTCYRDETFAAITRWKAETKIRYRPHAKAPGTKSHLRYEKYSKARTVGEALKLGSWPADWCWDYERGFIKVLGPVREDPIDIAQCSNPDALTEVDRIVYQWYTKELAKRYNLNYHDLFGTSDTSFVRAHRLIAQREAKARLAAAARAGRRISDQDVTEVLKAWAFVKNASRVNVMREGVKWVWSDTVGLVRDRNGSIHITQPTKLYPEVVEILVRYLKDRLPPEASAFCFTSLNLNCNYAAALHRDGNNYGPSFIKAFGDFTGGELNYWPEDDKSCDLEELPKNRKVQMQIGSGPDGGLALFNGNSAHSVEDFQGSRFSVVYFTLGCHDRASPEDRRLLESLGFAFPKSDADKYTILRAPRGYGSRASTKGGDQPSVLWWKNSELERRKFVPSKPRSAGAAAKAGAKPGSKLKATNGKASGQVKKHILKKPAAARAARGGA